jgi:catechol 2,3-dioxygenase
MQIESLGHVVLKVRNQEKAEAFYGGVLGLPIVARLDKYSMTFFSLGNHHDFAVMAIGDDAAPPVEANAGMHHVAFKIGDNLDTLREAKSYLEGAGLEVMPVDHGVTQSLYFHDPDGNELEVYVDTSDAWKRDPTKIASAEPFVLD